MKIGIDETPELVGNVRVLLDGFNVTESCRRADSVTGEIELLCRDIQRHQDWRLNGPAHVIPDAGELGPCVIRTTGDVVIKVL